MSAAPPDRQEKSDRLPGAGMLGSALFGTGVAAGALMAGRDRRAVLADPAHAELARAPQGRPLALRAPDGTALHAEVFGADDAPTVVLAHGWLCSARLWHHQLRDLADDLRVVTCELRGHGRSAPAATGDYSMATLAGDLAAVVDRTVPAGQQAVMVGHSMGAMVTVAWADAHPEQARATLAGAVLVNTGVEQLVGRARIFPAPAALSPAREAVGRRLLGWPVPWPSHPRPLVSRLVRAAVLGPDASPAQVDFCTRMVLTPPARVRGGFGATLASLDLTPRLQALTIPAVVIAGEHDRLTPPVHARAMAEVLPRATLVELPGVGHMAPLEAPARVTGAIRVLADLVLPPVAG
ncbi:MAG: alpha/beta hydrolase [Actinobacteria bacterium]|nr:alpha/beta hydrolase [Actinomycetota bacterium]